jgi:hypothetical protein
MIKIIGLKNIKKIDPNVTSVKTSKQNSFESFQPPESLNDPNFSSGFPSDVYALGILLSCLLNLSGPFSFYSIDSKIIFSDYEMKQLVSLGHLKPILHHGNRKNDFLYQELKKLILDCVKFNPLERLSTKLVEDMNIEVDSFENEMKENNEFVESTDRFQIMVNLFSGKLDAISKKEMIYIENYYKTLLISENSWNNYYGLGICLKAQSESKNSDNYYLKVAELMKSQL